MSDLIVVKDNELIEAGYRLSEVEQRLILLAIIKARQQYFSIEEIKGSLIEIHAKDYIELFNVDESVGYRVLKQASISLFTKYWQFKKTSKKGNEQIANRHFMSKLDYIDKEGTIIFEFHEDFIPMILELDKRFTTYDIEVIAKIDGRYAMRLFEMLMQYKNVGQLEISLDELRFRFALKNDEYARMDNFKRNVLDISVNEINKNTDLNVKYEQKKRGKNITGFIFKFKKIKEKEKIKATASISKERDDRTIDFVDNLTDIEREKLNKNRADDYINNLSKTRVLSENEKIAIHKSAQNQNWGLEAHKKQLEEQNQQNLAKQLEQKLEQKQKELEKLCETEFEILLENAEKFVKLNTNLIRKVGFENECLKIGDYENIVKTWKNSIYNINERQKFNFGDLLKK